MNKQEGFIINYDRVKRSILPIFTNVIYWASRVDYECACSAETAEGIFRNLISFEGTKIVEESTFLLKFPKFKRSYEHFCASGDDVYSIHILPRPAQQPVDTRPPITESVTHLAPPTDRQDRMIYFNKQIETLMRETNCATLIKIVFRIDKKKNISIAVRQASDAIAPIITSDLALTGRVMLSSPAKSVLLDAAAYKAFINDLSELNENSPQIKHEDFIVNHFKSARIEIGRFGMLSTTRLHRPGDQIPYHILILRDCSDIAMLLHYLIEYEDLRNIEYYTAKKIGQRRPYEFKFFFSNTLTDCMLSEKGDLYNINSPKI